MMVHQRIEIFVCDKLIMWPNTIWVKLRITRHTVNTKAQESPFSPLPVTCYQRKIIVTQKQFCHWLIKDWISVLKFQTNPRQVLIIYQNINRLNRRYLHLPPFHYLPPYFAQIQILALCKTELPVKNSKPITIVSVNFLMRLDGEKYFGGGQIGISLSWACGRSYRGSDKSLYYLWQLPD